MDSNETKELRPTILLVDDSPLNLGVIVGNLEKHGYNVLVATDGEEALARVVMTNPDLLLLDVMLPGLDGFEVCRRLQAHPQTADIPVIFLTSLGGIQDKVQGFEAGAVDYITKPLQIDEVRIRIGTHLKLRALQKTLEEKNRELQAEIVERKRMEEQLRLKEFALDHVHEAAYISDADFRILYVNEEACRVLGYSREELLKMTIMDIDADFSAEEMVSFKAARSVAQVHVFERKHKTRDGRIFPVEILTTSMEYQGAWVNVALVRDITERKAAEAALKESEARYRDSSNLLQSIFESSARVGIYALDRDYRYLAFNNLVREGAKRLWGTDIAVGMSMLDEAIDNDAHRAFCKQGFDYVLAGNNFSLESKEVKVINGETVYEYHDNHSSPIRDENGEVVGLTLFTANITDRKRIEHDLEESRTQLRGLIARLEDVREEERKHIAREVHDNLGQILSGLHLSIFRLENKYAANSEEMRKHIQETMALTDQAIAEVRNISSALRPVELDTGIHAALAWQAARFSAYSGIACEVHDDVAGISLDEDYSIALFRIAQESLTNVARHAGAERVDISLKKEADDYVLTVRDNGTGFDAGVKKAHSFGLVGMKERVAMLGGSIAINSSAGNGTEIIVSLPVRKTL